MAEEQTGSRTHHDLVLTGLTKTFGDFKAVDNLDLTVPQGEFFALLGPSGCGKTTTLRMVAGLEDPTGGTIRLGEEDITHRKPYRRPVNTVFQSYALFPHLSIFENVAFGLRRQGRKDVKKAVDEMLSLIELADHADRKPTQLSGGQQQRVALGRALINRPQVLLLDEPLGALDLKLRRQMQLELKRIQTEVGLTFVHVTHDQEEAMTMADTVAVMNLGKIEQMGAPEVLYDLPRTKFVANFLGQSNLLSGHVDDTDGEHIIVSAAHHKLRLRKSRAAAGSGDIAFGVRPEKTRIHNTDPGASAAGNSIGPGTLLDVSFTGVATQYLVDVPDAGRWAVYEQNLDLDRIDSRPGDTVWISWDPGHAFGVRP